MNGFDDSTEKYENSKRRRQQSEVVRVTAPKNQQITPVTHISALDKVESKLSKCRDVYLKNNKNDSAK